MGASTDSTDVLTELRSGARESLDRLVPLVYQELRAIAHRRIAGRDRGRTLSTTALVHEAYLKLVDQSRSEWRDRAHFLAVASLAMRRVLVDRARARVALKRGGDGRRLSLDEDVIGVDDQPVCCWSSTNRWIGWRRWSHDWRALSSAVSLVD